MRNQFEEFPEIAVIKNGYTFHEGLNKYLPKVHKCCNEELYFINGAWYAFQEQQKKMNKALN